MRLIVLIGIALTLSGCAYQRERQEQSQAKLSHDIWCAHHVFPDIATANANCPADPVEVPSINVYVH